jgi:hypothetical protein
VPTIGQIIAPSTLFRPLQSRKPVHNRKQKKHKFEFVERELGDIDTKNQQHARRNTLFDSCYVALKKDL